MILGLDISTHCVGYCLLDNDGQYVDVDYVDLSKIESFYKKVDEVGCILCKLKNIDTILVEQPLQMFKSNFSMSSVICLLQSFNSACRYLLYKHFNIEPVFVNVISARSILKIKVPRTFDTKQYIFEEIKLRKIIPESKWEYKRTGNPKTSNFDMCDAYIAARGGFLILKK